MLEADAVSVEVWTTILIDEPWVQVLKCIHRVRERQINDVLFKMATIKTTTFTKGYKVTLYRDWLRPTALYTIYKNNLNLDCPRDSVNTAIIHLYLTLPRNGRIQRVKQELQVYTRLSDKSILFESAKSGDRRTNRLGLEELKPILEKSKSIVRNHPRCPTLIRPIFRYAHLVPKGSESIHQKTLGHSICDIMTVDIFSRTIFPEMTQSRTKWYQTSICFEALRWTRFFDRVIAPSLSL